MSESKRRAAIYVRISRDADGREAGVGRQEADCRSLADRMGLSVVQVFTDNDLGASSQSKKGRPAYRDMLEAVRSGTFSVVLAYSTSRITRRPLDWEGLIQLAETHGLEVHTVASSSVNFNTADGKMILRYLAANDAAEAERISERVRRAKLQNVEQGAYRGGPRPFGYEAGGVKIHPVEAEVVREAARRLLAGESLRSIAMELADRGFTGTRATETPLSSTQLRAILLRPRNAALIEYRGKITGAAQWPAILDEDIWQAVKALLTDRSRLTNTGSSVLKHLGSSTYRCGQCGQTVRVSMTSGGYRVYRCKSHAHLSRRQEPIDELVRAVVVERLTSAGLKLAVAGPDSEGEAGELRDKITALRARREQLAIDYADGLMDGRQMQAAGQRIEGQLDDAEAALASLAAGSGLADVATAPDPGVAFKAAPIGKQRAVLNALVVVTLHAGVRGRPKGWTGGPYMDPESVEFTWKAAGA